MRVFAALLVLVATSARAEQLTEKIEVSVVNVDVTVTDRNGQPVRGLTRDHFDVFEDGVRQTITNFYVVEPSQGERFRRKVLVLIDNAHTTTYSEAVGVTQQVVRF
jgi:hypothetical protein